MTLKNIYEEDYVLMTIGIIILACFIFFFGKMGENNPTLSRNEIVENNSGNDNE